MKHLSALLEMLGTASPSGFEEKGQRNWLDLVRPHADDVQHDAYGNAWATRRGGEEGGTHLLLEAHADEIGFIVKHIGEKGFIHIDRIGGSDRAIARGRRVEIITANGPVTGVIGNTAIHLRDTKDDKVPEWHDLYLDIGARSPDEVAARGVRVGLPIVYAQEPFELSEGRLCGRAIDNRIGGFIIARVLEELGSGQAPDASVTAANCVQEEIGGAGARMMAYRLRPDVALVLDVTHATDSPGIKAAQHGKVELGAGPTVTHGTANHPRVVNRLLEVAAAEGVPVQDESSSRSTGTDTDDIYASRMGIPSALVSIPMRYMHSPVETIDLADVEHCIGLLVAFARSIQPGERFGVDLG
jgi:putative aminopeptidase FrvX